MVYPINSMVIFHGELLNNQRGIHNYFGHILFKSTLAMATIPAVESNIQRSVEPDKRCDQHSWAVGNPI